MSEQRELLPCPFCGGAVSRCDESPLYGGSIMHDETECLFKNNLLFHRNIAERWNSRPLENALRSRIAELENRIKNAIDSVNATENVIKCARVDTYKALERIKYILTAPPRGGVE